MTTQRYAYVALLGGAIALSGVLVRYTEGVPSFLLGAVAGAGIVGIWVLLARAR
ncbi:hypothetical protein [Streptomyces sp. URMC 123]|uniref:hypothetical protein n=1 Tax=Streptomyces sp. URMC 123 TaxID=3423403 RepID=UPI003F19F2BE